MRIGTDDTPSLPLQAHNDSTCWRHDRGKGTPDKHTNNTDAYDHMKAKMHIVAQMQRKN